MDARAHSLSVVLQDYKVLFDGMELDLQKRKKIFQVFEAFSKASETNLSRQDLIYAVYPEFATKELSGRQRACVNHNIVKLISRARSLVSKKFKTVDRYIIDWFHYDATQERWSLYQLRSP